LIEKWATESLIRLKGKIPEVEAESSIEKDRFPQIIESGILAYGEKKGLIFETLEARIMK
jgi:hypothetical protein